MKQKIKNSVIGGIVVLLPIGIMVYAISFLWTIIDWIEKTTHLDTLYHHIDDQWGWLIGNLITIVLAVVMLGLIHFVSTKIISDKLDGLKRRIPFYNQIASITSSIMQGVNKDSFKRSIWVWHQGRWELGLVTYEDDTYCNVVVQFGMTISGQTYPVLLRHTQSSVIDVEQVIAYKTSGGIANVGIVMDEFVVINQKTPDV